jgi:hypothetical protein
LARLCFVCVLSSRRFFVLLFFRHKRSFRVKISLSYIDYVAQNCDDQGISVAAGAELYELQQQWCCPGNRNSLLKNGRQFVVVLAFACSLRIRSLAVKA